MNARSWLRPGPAVGYVHPRATTTDDQDLSNLHIDVAEDSAPNHLTWIADLCDPYLGERVLDLGAGTGALTERFAPGREVVAVELADWCLDELQRRFAGHPSVTVRRGDARALTDMEPFDSVVMINVLEHLRDDVLVLRDVRRLLRAGGRVVIYVPAFNGLYGTFDARVGHYRRYAKWRMRAVFEHAGLRLVTMRYTNALAIPGWVWLARREPQAAPTASLSAWDRFGVPTTRAIESRVSFPVGLNLLAVGARGH
jgi:SAM-dependent methyltransferase